MVLVWTLDAHAAAGRWEAPEGGGGSTQRERLFGNPVSLNDGESAYLTWDEKLSGDDLLDLTAPDSPLIVTAGVYAVTVSVGASDTMTDDGIFNGTLLLDADGDNAQTSMDSAPANARDHNPAISLTLTYYVPAGGRLGVYLTSSDGGLGSIGYAIAAAIIQRIS